MLGRKSGRDLPANQGICDMPNMVSLRIRGALFASTALLAMPAGVCQDRPVDALDAPHTSSVVIDGLNDAAAGCIKKCSRSGND